MIPGARESWRSQLHYETKNIENRRVLFAGDDFENIAFLYECRNSVDLVHGFVKKDTGFVSIKGRGLRPAHKVEECRSKFQKFHDVEMFFYQDNDLTPQDTLMFTITFVPFTNVSVPAR